MSASDGDGNWYMDAVGGVKCGTCGSRKHGTHACDVDLSKLKCFSNKYGHISANCHERKKGKGDNKQVIKGKGKQKGKKGKGKGKGFGKKGKMNEVGYENDYDYDGTDMWWQDDGTWWEDPSWFETSQVWDNSWDSSWDTAWIENNGDAWNETWSWPVEDGQADTGTGEATPAVQSLVLSPLISDVFHGFSTGLTVDTGVTGKLWDLNFGWMPESASGSDSALLCGMLNTGCCEPPSADSSSSSSTAKTTVHEPPFFGEHFLGLQGPGDLGAVDAAGAECGEGLLSTVGGRIHLQRVGTSTFLNVQDTVSHACQLHKFSPVWHPLLSELMMGNDSQHWWLLDSGAAATVMATASRATYGAWVTNVQTDRFRAVNGSRVSIDGSADVSVWVGFKKKNDNLGRFPIYRQAELKCLVGGISHNIISTNTLCECGWEFNQNPEGAEVTHCESGLRLADVCNFGGCPWVKLDPAWMYSGSESAQHEFVMSEGMDAVHDSAHLNPLSRAAEAALETHRMHGHVQADFGVLTTRGEMVDEEAEGTIKVLVLTELSTNCVGYVVVGHETRPVKTQICKWLDDFGLASSTSSVVLHTDAERAVSELVGTSSEKYAFLIRRARPQQHQSNGGAERAVRRLKESLAVLRAEMNEGGADICFTEKGLNEIGVEGCVTSQSAKKKR
eukprot:s1103_g6.t1